MNELNSIIQDLVKSFPEPLTKTRGMAKYMFNTVDLTIWYLENEKFKKRITYPLSPKYIDDIAKGILTGHIYSSLDIMNKKTNKFPIDDICYIFNTIYVLLAHYGIDKHANLRQYHDEEDRLKIYSDHVGLIFNYKKNKSDDILMSVNFHVDNLKKLKRKYKNSPRFDSCYILDVENSKLVLERLKLYCDGKIR